MIFLSNGEIVSNYNSLCYTITDGQLISSVDKVNSAF